MFLLIFRERNIDGNIDLFPPKGTLTRDQTWNLGMWLTGNRTQNHFGAWDDILTNWATWPERSNIFLTHDSCDNSLYIKVNLHWEKTSWWIKRNFGGHSFTTNKKMYLYKWLQQLLL